MRARNGYDITAAQCNVLLEHIDGPTAINFANQSRHNGVKGLLERGFLRVDYRHHPPRQTFITEPGRGILAKVLAAWFEVLVRAQNGKTQRLIAETFEREAKSAPEPEYLDETG